MNFLNFNFSIGETRFGFFRRSKMHENLHWENVIFTCENFENELLTTQQKRQIKAGFSIFCIGEKGKK
jgi:hypothetical protein